MRFIKLNLGQHTTNRGHKLKNLYINKKKILKLSPISPPVSAFNKKN